MSAAETAWLSYRDQYHRDRPWADQRRLGRQIRRREFLAGYEAGIAAASSPGSWWISTDMIGKPGSPKYAGPFSSAEDANAARAAIERLTSQTFSYFREARS